MASISGLCSSSIDKITRKLPFPNQSKLITSTPPYNSALHAVAREIPASLSNLSAGAPNINPGLEKDPKALWRRYVEWVYQHKELGLYLDVSRVGFTDGFVEEMEPRFQLAFKDMEELEKGAISNPDEGRMVGHYWLRNPKLAPNSYLRLQIENTLEAVCKFAGEVVDGKVSFNAVMYGVMYFL